MAVLDALVPPSLARCAQRLSTILAVLGVLVLVLFPQSARAGTEVPLDRWMTGGMLVVVGLALRFLPRSTLPLLLVHGAAQAAFGGTWAAVLSAACLLYAAVSWWRGRAAPDDGVGVRVGDEPEPEMHSADVVRENVEAIVMALIIALTVREFLYEAFLIPTSSMYPTILGKKEAVGRTQGDRLLATKVPMLTGDPPRWSIVVFKFPLYRKVNYIKRLVGLPGETVEIRDGDIYVNGEVAAKPEEVQNQLWFQEFPDPDSPLAVNAVWKARDGVATWHFDATSATGDVPALQESWIAYDQTLDQRDTDLRVGAVFDVRTIDAENGALLLRAEGAGRAVELEIGPSGASLSAPGAAHQPLEGVVLPDGGARVDLGVADRVIRVWINGHLVARVPHADAQHDGADRPKVSLGLRGAEARISDMLVARDLQYGHTRRWEIPDDGFVMLGDNTDHSADSRLWDVIELTTADGRVYTGQAQVKREDNSSVGFREENGFYQFLDVDGIVRKVPVATTKKRTGVPAPFVRRKDLIGRAFVIFFPFPPFGDFRPHFLP